MRISLRNTLVLSLVLKEPSEQCSRDLTMKLRGSSGFALEVILLYMLSYLILLSISPFLIEEAIFIASAQSPQIPPSNSESFNSFIAKVISYLLNIIW